MSKRPSLRIAPCLALGLMLAPFNAQALPTSPTPLPRPAFTPPPKPADSVLYGQIFDLQAAGQMSMADIYIAQIDDPILMGHVKFQRYMHPTGYRASWPELRDWLSAYGDHPGAKRIYRLAQRRRPSGVRMPKAPPALDVQPVLRADEGMFSDGRSYGIKRHVRRLLARERPTQALSHVEANLRRISDPEEAYLRSVIARSYYVERKFDKALEQAIRATARRDVINISDWHAGLAAWRLGDIEQSIRHFSSLAENPRAETRLIAMGAFWAARGLRQLGRIEEAELYLQMAAASGAHFYAFLAMQQLAGDVSINWLSPTPIPNAPILDTPPVRRAFALAAADRPEWGEQEILNILRNLSHDEMRGLLPEIRKADFAGVEYSIGAALQTQVDGIGQLADAEKLISLMQSARFARARSASKGKNAINLSAVTAFDTLRPSLHRAMYPLPALGAFFLSSPRGIDRALAFATMRQESRFRPQAKSRAGARGLMQIMPATAAFITGDRSLRLKYGREKLLEKDVNIEIGNRYFRKLLAADHYSGNLIFTLAGYNAGPGNVARWRRDLREINADPLLFLESIPITETRIYVRRVMENLWIYRNRLDQQAVSLRLLAAGSWPRLVEQDETALVAPGAPNIR